MTGRRIIVYAIALGAVVLIVLGIAGALGARDALRDAELDRLHVADVRLLRKLNGQRSAFQRQLKAATASVDSAEAKYATSERLRRRLVIVPLPGRQAVTNPTSVDHATSPRPETEVTHPSDTVHVEPRVVELVAALDSTVEAQRRALARQGLAIRSASSALTLADSLLANRNAQIANLTRRLPSRFWRNVERVALIGGAGFVGYNLARR